MGHSVQRHRVCSAEDVSATSDGGAFVTGSFKGTVKFGSTTMTSSKNRRGVFVESMFVGKVSSVGAWEWVTQAELVDQSFGLGVSVLSDGGAIGGCHNHGRWKPRGCGY